MGDLLVRNDLESKHDGIAALEAELEEILQQNKGLKEENEVFETYYEKTKFYNNEEDDHRKDNRRGKKKAKDRSVLLTWAQKLQLTNFVFEEIQKEIENTKSTSEKAVDSLQAKLQEAEQRIFDLKRDALEFKRDIVVGAENQRTGKTASEKVVRYMEDKMKDREADIERLRLKNVTLKNQIKKVGSQLKQKEEMGDVLHYIDFHQLQIENKQHLAKIDERNQELLKLKMSTGNTVQVLNTLKNELNELNSKSEWMLKEIKSRKRLTEKIEGELERVNEEISREKKIAAQLQTDSEESGNMPHTLDYVEQKKQMYELQAKVKDWERKLEIALIRSKRTRVKA